MTTANRVRLCTAPTPAAIAVVRLSGPGVTTFLARRFSRPAAVARAVHGLLRDEAGHTLDDPVVVLCDDRTADLNLHGGTWVVRSILNLTERDGFAVVAPADLPDAAAVDGPTPLWREVTQHLPAARTPAAARMLLAQPAAWSRVQPADVPAILADPSGRWLLSPPTVAVVGPANVGKSTLANQLFGQARSITANVPGTTRDWVGEMADLDGLAVRLIDTPGIRATDDAIEAAAICAGRQQGAAADLIVLVLDRSVPLCEDARALLAAHPNAVRVVNKADVPAAWAADGLPTVATTGQGVHAVRAAVRRRFGCEPIDPERPRWWTQRQRAILEDALANGAGLPLAASRIDSR